MKNNGTNEKERIRDIDLSEYLDDEQPSDWAVMLYNDQVTPFEFVVIVLHEVFDINPGDAFGIAMVAHRTGKAAIINGISEQEANDYITKVEEIKNAFGCTDLLVQAEPVE